MRLYRFITLIYQYSILPIFTPICALIVTRQGHSISGTISIVSLTLLPLTYFLIEYHQLELEPYLPEAEHGRQDY
jgi:hypothetical protein